MSSIEEIRIALAQAREQLRAGCELLRAGQQLLSEAEELLVELDRHHPGSLVPPQLHQVGVQTSSALTLAGNTIEIIDGFTASI